MKKKIAGVLLTLCMMLALLPVQTMADDAMPEVKLDVSMENTENDDYKVMDGAINIRKENVVYELTGTTDRKLQMWGSNSPDPVKTFYLRLNNATINGGLTITNSYGAKLVIEVMDDTTNTIKNVYAVDLTITGKGTLNATDLGVTQQNNNDSRKLTSALYIKDTTIKVNKTTSNPSQWNGVCVLDGDANVTYTTDTEYAALALGQTSRFDHSLTMKGNSKLYCLHSNADEPSQYAVAGLEGNDYATITLQDNAYLEAQGRASSGKWVGEAVLCGGDIVVKDNAEIKATAQGTAIATWGNVQVTGGKITAESTGSNGIYAEGTVSISNAEAELRGRWPALFSVGSVTVKDSTLTATSTDRAAIRSNDEITLENSWVDANGADGYYGIAADNGTKVSGCWIETTGPETLAEAPDSIADSVLFNGNAGKVIGNGTLLKDETITADMTLDIPEGTTLTVPEGKTLANQGKISVNGELKRLGTIICDSHTGGTATCKDKAVCDVCQAAYGELDGKNHTNLVVVPAKAATKDAEGNIEYWYCDGCGKYYADAAATKELAKADTVTAKLPEEPKTPDTPADPNTPSTGDAGSALWAAVLLASGCAVIGVTAKKRRYEK